MSYDMLTLQGRQTSRWRKEIRALLAEFSDEVKQNVEAGRCDKALAATYNSPHAYFCLAVNRAEDIVSGMYLATYMPIALSTRLYIDGVVVRQSCRRQRVLQNVLVPHMRQLAVQLGCSTICLTSSKSSAQAAYQTSGFTSPTTAYRMIP